MAWVVNKKLRFVIPIHGFEQLHDGITRVIGSYTETISSMKKLSEFSNDCLFDLKIILNSDMIESNESFMKTLDAFDEIPFNNAVHITKMADTKVSELNNCTSLNNEDASRYTLFLLEHFSKRNCVIKVFDTCIKDIKWLNQNKVEKYGYHIEVKGKDFAHEEDIALTSNTCPYAINCANKDYCLSSVFNYKVLEFSGGRIYENLE